MVKNGMCNFNKKAVTFQIKKLEGIKMRKRFSLFFLISLSALFSYCSSEKNSFTNDVIPVVNVSFNGSDTLLLSDLFFAENYDAKFKKNDFVDLKYLPAEKKLIVATRGDLSGIVLAEFELNGETAAIPLRIRRLQTATFEYKPNKSYKELTVFGEFNGWNRHKDYFEDSDGDGVFTATVNLEPGKYQYKFFGDGEEIVDPNNPENIPNGMGGINSVLYVADTSPKNNFLHKLKFEEDRDDYNLRFFYGGGNIKTDNVIALINNNVLPAERIEVNENKITLRVPEAELSGKKRIRIAVNSEGIASNVQNVFLQNGNPVGTDKSVFDWRDAVIYSLMIDRFYDGDKTRNKPVVHDSLSLKVNYMGGDLQGIIDKLNEGYFDKLGVNVIWISPVYDNPNEAYKEYPAPHRWFSGYHGYWPISSTRVDEHFGTIEKVKELVKAAHTRGIKVLLDFVSNHVHKDHPYFKEHRDWFGTLELPDGRLNLRMWDEHRLTTWFEPYLPSFDYVGSQTAADTMTANAVWWLKETGADGYRHDAVKHVPNSFWRELTRKMKTEVEPNREIPVYQIGETFGSYELVSSYVNNGQLDAQFAFNLYNIAQAAFIDPSVSFSDLNSELKKNFLVYGYNHVMGNIMDSHDKNRFMAYADGDLDLSQWNAVEEGWNDPPKVDHPSSYKKATLYLAYEHAIPGIPVIYYGSEFGMTGASDPDNRRMMRFDDELNEYEKEMLSNVSAIVKLRREHSALRYGDFLTLEADKNIFAFIRSDFNERILVVLNKSEQPQKLNLQIPLIYKGKQLRDLISGDLVNYINGFAAFDIEGFGYRFFEVR